MKVWSVYSPTSFSQCAKENILSLKSVPSLHDIDVAEYSKNGFTVFVPLAAQGAYQSHLRWAHIKIVISQFFSLKLVIFETKINGK